MQDYVPLVVPSSYNLLLGYVRSRGTLCKKTVAKHSLTSPHYIFEFTLSLHEKPTDASLFMICCPLVAFTILSALMRLCAYCYICSETTETVGYQNFQVILSITRLFYPMMYHCSEQYHRNFGSFASNFLPFE